MMEVVLQFTQPDRDMLRDVAFNVKQILEGMHEHEAHDNTRFADMDKRFDIHTGRIEKLEAWQIKTTAMGTVLGALLGFLLHYLMK